MSRYPNVVLHSAFLEEVTGDIRGKRQAEHQHVCVISCYCNSVVALQICMQIILFLCQPLLGSVEGL